VRCRGVIQRSGEVPDCDLTLVEIETKATRVVLQPPRDVGIDEPTWSPDGAQVALFRGREVVVIDVETGQELRRVDRVRLYDRGADWTVRKDRLIWGPDPAHIYVMAELVEPPLAHETEGLSWQEIVRGPTHIGTAPAVGTVDLARNAVEWVGSFRFLDDKVYKVNADGSDEPAAASVLEHPAVKAFNGEPRNRVPRVGDLVWSADRRYYFYVKVRQGWFARDWIEGYDVSTRETFDVRTLSRALYRK
jgi:hypothetical protein